MKGPAIYFCLAFCLLFGAVRASGQAEAQVSEMETLNGSGWLAIKITCDAYGSWDDGSGQDYAGVSIGDSTYHGCQLNDPNGQSNYVNTGVFYGNNIQYFDLPVTQSGTWDYWASFWIWMTDCDSDTEDCQGYPYSDYWGYTLGGAGYPIECGLNGDTCYGDYDGTYWLTIYSGLEYAYSGNSSTGAFGTFYVDALAIDISPGYSTLEGGEEVTFTAAASNTGNFLPFYQWTLVSGPGSGIVSGSSDQDYTYTAPSQITSGNTTATIKGCITNLTSSPVCQKVTIDLLQETISVGNPNPNVLLANGSTSALNAYIDNGAANATATWTSSQGASIPSGLSTTYTAPAASRAMFPSSNTATDSITATVQGSSPAVSAATSLTLVEPVTVTNVSPASWTAGTANIPVTITGTGFSANSVVTISSPSWPSMTYTCAPTASPTTIPCSVTIPANLSNMPASQGATISVSTTTSGLTSPFTYGTTIGIVPIAYTYSISLLTSTSSLTYGYSSTITPVITCKVASTGAACAGNVSNPQLANFKILSGPGSLSNTSNAASTSFTDSVLIAYPAQNATVQGCASVSTTVCASTNFSIPVTSITLNPPTMAAPLAGGKTQAFTASIQNEGTATGLTWTLTPTPSSAAPGTLTSATTTITVQGSPTSGTSGPNTYTAPATITSAAAVTLNVCMTANTSICATPVTIHLPGFSITATNNNPSQTALSLGHSMSYAINASALDGFSGTVALSVSGLPTGVTAKLSAPSITTSTSGSVTLTLTSAYSTSTYIGNSTISVTGSSGSMAVPASIPLTTRPLQYAGQCNVPTTISKFYPNPLYPY